MKKHFSILLIVITIITLTACSNTTDIPKLLNKEGIAPYELTERESYLLRDFGIENNSQIIAFNPPKEALTVKVNVYCLNDSNWESIGSGAIYLGNVSIPAEQLKGTFTMLLKENYSIDYHINCAGRASYKTNAIDVDSKYIISSRSF